jgi:hypothetical protein
VNAVADSSVVNLAVLDHGEVVSVSRIEPLRSQIPS